MGFTSLQGCMDSADWLQGTIHEENGMDCSSPSGDMLTCSRPLMERRLRPQHDQALKCPRCDSTHTKFCYYNNYSLSQPRYFCKTCRRYWTKGGTLRNIPVGGGCRKNKKVSKKSSNANNDHHHLPIINPSSSSSNPTDLNLSFPDQFHLNNILANPSFINMGLLEQSSNRLPIDFMDSKLEAIVGRNNYDFMGNAEMGLVNGIGDHQNNHYHGLCSPYGLSGGGGIDGNGNSNHGNGNFVDTCQRLMIPYDHHQGSSEDVKPNTKLLSLEWQDQGCSDNGKDTFGYLNNLGSWTGMINGYGSSTTTNPLV